MARLIIAVVLTALVVAFAMANGHHVSLSFVFGAPVQVRQIFLLATSVGIGIVGTLLYQQLSRVKKLRESERHELGGASSRKITKPEDLTDD